jgi:pyruvate/2-oxoglutarate dehydrogenase complex dihydrolipoamide dehydrogenase (E3) component
MVRSILLRGFDANMSDKIGAYMEGHGQRFLKKCIPTKFTKTDNNKINVEYRNEELGKTYTEEFDTVLLAIGRSAVTTSLGLKEIGVQLAKNNKIVVDENEQSSVPNIYSLGDCAEGRPELTPPAIMAGRLLARRLYGNSKQLMNYTNIATTVFTPIEYGCVGYTEEQAYEK